MENFKKNINDNFEDFYSQNISSDVLNNFRKSSFASLNSLGLPSLKDEDWRFTDLNDFYKSVFKHRIQDNKKFDTTLIPNSLNFSDVTFVYLYNGKLSHFDSIENVKIEDLESYISSLNSNEFEEIINGHSEKNKDFTFEMNSAFLKDGVYIEVEKNIKLKKPIVIINYYDSEASFVCHRNIINFQDLSEGQIVEYTFSDDNVSFLSNKATCFLLGNSTNVEHLSVDESNKSSYILSNLKISQKKDSNFTTDTILIGGKLYRNNVHPVLNGEGSNSNILGLYLPKDSQHMDNYMFVEHIKPNCGSRQLYKGILKDTSKGVFHGRILVHNEAQKTDAKQTNRNLLLSEKAQVDTKPQLEIYADDVKCTHGATTGQIDNEALYYLRARGINLEDAKLIMIRSFTEELLEFISSNFILDLHKSFVENWFLNSQLAKPE